MTGNLFKNPCNIISCSNEKIADDFSQDMACGWQDQDKIACYNPFDTLPHSPRNSENTEKWEQFLVATCTLISPFFWSITWAPDHRGQSLDLLRFPWHQICGVSTNSNQFPKHPLGVQQVHLLLIPIHGVTADSVGWGLKSVLSLDASREVPSHSCLWLNG